MRGLPVAGWLIAVLVAAAGLVASAILLARPVNPPPAALEPLVGVPAPTASATASTNVRTQPPFSAATPEAPGSIGRLIEIASGQARELWAANETGGLPSFSSDGRWLAYVKTQGQNQSNADVMLLDVQSSAAPQLMAAGHTPQISPDGRFLAFVVTQGPSDPRAQVSAITAGTTRLLETPGQQPMWSPDGRWLTYWGPFNQNADRVLYLVDTQDWSVRQASSAYLCQCDARYGPFWSPDSRWFYHPYASDRQQALIEPATLARTAVPGYPYWSPDGKQFVAIRQGALLLYEVASGSERVLVRDQGDIHNPLWSPDGAHLTYEGASAGITALSATSGQLQWQLRGFSIGWSVDGGFFAAAEKGGRLEGGELKVARSTDGTPLHSIGDNVLNPAWSPSEPLIAFTRIDPSGCNRPDNPVKLSLHLFNARTGGERQLLQGVESICRGSRPIILWSPNGRHLLLCGSCGGRRLSVRRRNSASPGGIARVG